MRHAATFLQNDQSLFGAGIDLFESISGLLAPTSDCARRKVALHLVRMNDNAEIIV